MKAIRYILIIAVLFFNSAGISYGQLQAPKQIDTLFIQSMSFHYDNIRQENWPFKYVIRKADAFVFGSQEFKILSSYSYDDGNKMRFHLSDGKEESNLEITSQDVSCVLKFSGYELVCNSWKIFDSSHKSKTDARENFPGKTNVKVEGKLDVYLSDRSVIGVIPKVIYNVQESGTVVVTIWVDNYGTVQKAIPGAEGTTITDEKLWAAVRQTAMNTHFSANSNSPELEEGIIKYIFHVK